MSAKIHERYEDFAKYFFAPLMRGGLCAVAKPLTPAMLSHFTLATPADSDAEAAIREGLAFVGGALAPCRSFPFPDRGSIALAMVAHNLLFLTDPELDRLFRRGSRERVVEWIDELLEAVPLPQTRGEALARHAVVQRFLEVCRRDVEVTSWAVTYEFLGRPVPRNVVAAPKLRLIRQNQHDIPVQKLLADTDGSMKSDVLQRLRAMVARSPITEILGAPTLSNVRFSVATLRVLSDPAVRHGIADAIVKDGLANYTAVFGRALRELSAVGPPPSFLYTALAFVAELQLLEVLDMRRGKAPKSVPDVGDEELFSAVLPALFQHQGALSFMLTLDDRDLEKVKTRARELFHLAGEDAVRFALSILDRAVSPEAAQELNTL